MGCKTMTHKELDDKIEAVIGQVCRRVGATSEDPPARWVREIFVEAGLTIKPIKTAHSASVEICQAVV